MVDQMIFNGQIKEKYGLCFAGGGGKGAYEIGVWKALEEFTSVRFDVVSGASVGALNAALFATVSVEEAERIWKTITPDKLLKPQKEVVIQFLKDALLKSVIYRTGPLAVAALSMKRALTYYPFISLTLKHIAEEGVFSRQGLKDIIESEDVAKKLGMSSTKCIATICNEQSKKFVVEHKVLNKMPTNEIVDILLASSAMPVIYGRQTIQGKKYRDGGILDNVPIEPLYGCGCTHIVAVHLKNSLKKGNKKGNRPLSDGNKNMYIEPYENIPILHICPSTDLKGLWGTLDFTPKTIEKLIQCGYEDTKKSLLSFDSKLFLPKEYT